MRLKQLLAAMTMLVTLLFFAGSARAATCDQVVGDDAGLFGSGSASVDAAARQLAAQGAFVRVRTTASLDTYNDIPGMIRVCPTWKTGTAARSDLLVFVLYRDPQTNKGKANVYAGGRFQNRLNAQWQGIKTGQIGPRFNAGDYTGAAVGGLNGISGALGGTPVAVQPPAPTPVPTQLAPRPSPIVVTPVPAPVPAPPVVAPTPVPSSGGSSAGLWVFLGLLVLAGGGVAFYFVRRSKAESKAAQQSAKNKATSCATEIEAFSPMAMTVLEAKVAGASKGCSSDDARALTALLNAFKTRSAEATKQYGRLSQSSNPDDDGKSVQEYASMERSYDTLLASLDEAKTSQTALDNKLGEIKRMADQAKPALEKLGKDIETAATDIGEAQKAGFKTDALESTLAEVMAEQETATADIGAGRAAAATSACSASSVKAKKVSADAKALATRKRAIETRIARVRESISATAAYAETAKKDFDAIQSGFAVTSWEGVKNNVSNALLYVKSATQDCDDAVKAIGMDVQDWKGAETNLGHAEGRIENADRYLSDVTKLKQALQAAKANMPAKLAAARSAVTEANRFIAKNAADIEDILEAGLLQKLAETGAQLPTDEAVLKQKLPDYLAIVATAEAATKVANEVLQSARSDAQHTVQQRAEAAAAVESATAGIATAAQYVRENAGTVGTQYDMTIKSARSMLASARQQAGNPAEQLRLANRAITMASDALTGAREVVRIQRQREEDARQQRLAEERERASEVERQRLAAIEAARQAESNAAFAGGVIVGAAIGSLNNGNNRSSDNSSLGSGGGLMGGDDSLSGGTDDSSSYTSPSPDLDSGGGGLMGGSDDLSGSDTSSGGGSNDDL